MKDAILYPQEDHPYPKIIGRSGGAISNTYGQIPRLREPFKPNQSMQKTWNRWAYTTKRIGMRKYAKSIVVNNNIEKPTSLNWNSSAGASETQNIYV